MIGAQVRMAEGGKRGRLREAAQLVHSGFESGGGRVEKGAVAVHRKPAACQSSRACPVGQRSSLSCRQNLPQMSQHRASVHQMPRFDFGPPISGLTGEGIHVKMLPLTRVIFPVRNPYPKLPAAATMETRRLAGPWGHGFQARRFRWRNISRAARPGSSGQH
jgi:hypothetical protein